MAHLVSRSAPAPAVPRPRVPFLDQLLDRALSGAVRWPALDRLLQAAAAEQPPTRAEMLTLPGRPVAERLIDMLIDRGVIAERAQRRRLVLVRILPDTVAK